MTERTNGGNPFVSRRWRLRGLLVVGTLAVSWLGWAAWSRPWFHRDQAGQTVRTDGAGSRVDSDQVGENHPGHVESQALMLSPQARRSLRVQLAEVQLQQFVETIAVPGIVVERPGRSVGRRDHGTHHGDRRAD